VPWDDAIVVSAGKLRKLWDSLSELRRSLCERRLERTVLSSALLPVKTAQFTHFFRQVWRHTVKSLSLTESVQRPLNDQLRRCLHEGPQNCYNCDRMKDKSTSGFEGTWSGCKDTLWKISEPSFDVGFQQFPGKNPRRVNTVFRRRTEDTWSGVSHFQHQL